MYMITYRNKPVTLEKLYHIENQTNGAGYRSCDSHELEGYIASRTKRGCIELYIHHFGFTWKERPKFINCDFVYPDVR